MLFRPRTWLRISACLSVVLILLGGITIAFVDDIYRNTINEYMIMSPQSVRYEPWRKSLYPLTFKVYLFNWTNPDNFRSGEKPRLVEMGPYTYSEYDEKVDLQWHDNHTVSYRLSKVWYFDPERSNGSLEDLVTTVDIVSVTAANVAETKSYWFKRFVSLAMVSTKDYSTHTVDEMLFKGYDDNLLRVLKTASYFSSEGSGLFPHSKFGIFYKTNDSSTAQGVFNMATGGGDISQTGLLKKWNYNNHTEYFPGSCGRVEGTSGELWPPWRTKNDTISLFAKELCSSLELEFADEAEVEGLAGYKYTPAASNFDNGSVWASSSCKCGHGSDRCVPSGVMPMSACKFGSPMYLSFPHFFGADPHYVRQLEGVRPERRKHQFSVTLEPNTGVPLEIFGRTQFSMMLEAKPNNRYLISRSLNKNSSDILHVIRVNTKSTESLTLATSNNSREKLSILVSTGKLGDHATGLSRPIQRQCPNVLLRNLHTTIVKWLCCYGHLMEPYMAGDLPTYCIYQCTIHTFLLK